MHFLKNWLWLVKFAGRTISKWMKNTSSRKMVTEIKSTLKLRGTLRKRKRMRKNKTNLVELTKQSTDKKLHSVIPGVQQRKRSALAISPVHVELSLNGPDVYLPKSWWKKCCHQNSKFTLFLSGRNSQMAKIYWNGI